jgi:hypothetical protein
VQSISANDRAEILDLISEYAYTFDEDRIGELVDLFVDGGEWSIYLSGLETPLLTTSSNAERRTVLQEVRSGPINQAGMPRHFQTSTILRRVSPDRIFGRTMVVATQQPYDGTECRIVFSGVYEDQFVYSERRWRFFARRGLLDATSLPSG